MNWENFTREEFACQCGCGTNEIQDELIDVFQDIRTASGVSMTINSGYRCPNHPIEAKKHKGPGEHAEGGCGDIGVTHLNAFKVLQAAMAHPKVTGVGIKQKGRNKKRYIHIGIGPADIGRPRPHIWSY